MRKLLESVLEVYGGDHPTVDARHERRLIERILREEEKLVMWVEVFESADRTRGVLNAGALQKGLMSSKPRLACLC